MISIYNLIIISLAFLTSSLNHLFLPRYIGKNSKTNLPDWLSTHPDTRSQSKCRTIRTLACSLVEGITSTAVTKLYQIVASVQLEPKVAILNCCDFRLHHWNIYGNHMEIMPWFWEPNLTWLHHWGSEWHLRVQAKHASMSSSLAPHHSVLPSWVNSWKAPRPC